MPRVSAVRKSGTDVLESGRKDASLEAILKEVRLIAETQMAIRPNIEDIKFRLMMLDVIHKDFGVVKGALMELTRDLKALKGELAVEAKASA